MIGALCQNRVMMTQLSLASSVYVLGVCMCKDKGNRFPRNVKMSRRAIETDEKQYEKRKLKNMNIRLRY